MCYSGRCPNENWEGECTKPFETNKCPEDWDGPPSEDELEERKVLKRWW